MSDSVTPDDDREEYLARLGVVLRLGRKAAGLRQEEAARRLGVNSRAFTRWEAGDNAISSYDLVRLVRLYGIEADLVLNPPASKVEIKRRLGPVAAAAAEAARRATLRPLDADDNA